MRSAAALLLAHCAALAAEPVFRAGAASVDIAPEAFPVLVNAMFEERTASRVVDPLSAKALVLDDGSMRIALCVVDTCMMPRDLCDEAKELASRSTGIPVERMLVSATHTHSAPSAMGCLGSRMDPAYRKMLPGRIAKAIEAAATNLAPALLGATVVQAPEHTFNRRWIYRSDKVGTDPFGDRTVRANMHPGHENPDAVGPSGPVDAGLSLVSLIAPDGRRIALLANFSMHYYESELLSSDYFGRFAGHVARMLGANAAGDGAGKPPFVAILSQGTSGDLMWMDYGKPRKQIGYDAYARELAEIAVGALRGLRHEGVASLAMAESKLRIGRRSPSPERLAWARKVAEGIGDRPPRGLPEVYAREAIFLHDDPEAELKLQAIRIGAVGIAAIPNEVFALTGLKIKARSPLETTFTIELANGAEGYIPPPEQHVLGGYTTWPARTAGLVAQAEPRIAEAVLGLLEKVSGKPRRASVEPDGPHARAVMARKPAAYWRLGEMEGPAALDASGNGRSARLEDGIALYLPGAAGRCIHLAGGRLVAESVRLGRAYTVELEIWNAFPSDAREVTAYIYSRAAGEALAIGGTSGAAGKLVLECGGKRFEGRTPIDLKTWRRVDLVRDRAHVRVHLDASESPEIDAECEPGTGDALFFGGRAAGEFGLEGKLDEVAVFDRALAAGEIRGE